MLETITISEFLIALAAIGGAVAIIVKALKPWDELKNHVSEHDEMLKRDLARLDTN